MTPTPLAIANKFGVDGTNEVGIAFNTYSASWNRTKVRFTWDSLSKCTIALIDVPSGSLWGGSDPEYKLIDDNGAELKSGNVQGAKTFTAEDLHSSKYTIVITNDGTSKEYDARIPASIQLVDSNIENKPPSIKITPYADFTGSSSIEWQGVEEVDNYYEFYNSRANLANTGSATTIPLPVQWYIALEQPTKITMGFNQFNFSDRAQVFDPSYSIIVPPPKLSFFRPKITSSNITADAQNGYELTFELAHLSPSEKVTGATFVMVDGESIPASIKGNNGRINISSRRLIEKLNGVIKGNLKINPYHLGDDVGCQIEQDLGDEITIKTLSGLIRDGELHSCLSITSHAESEGVLNLKIRELENTEEQGVNHTQSFPSGDTSFTVSDIRGLLPGIDRWFFDHRGKELTIDAELIPHGNPELYPVKSESFTIFREERLVEDAPQDVSSCLEGGQPIEWKVEYIKEYYPSTEPFKLIHCGREIISTSMTDLCFEIDQPSYDQFRSNNAWILKHGETTIIEGACTMPEISLRREINELTYILDSTVPFSRISEEVEVETNNQPGVKYRLELLKGEDKSVQYQKEFTFEDGRISDKIDGLIKDYHEDAAKEFDLTSLTHWALKVSTPSRSDNPPLLVVNISTKGREGATTTALRRMAREFLKTWNGDPKRIREIKWFARHKEICIIFGQSSPEYQMKHFEQRQLYAKMIDLTNGAEEPYWRNLLRFMRKNGWLSDNEVQDNLEKIWRKGENLAEYPLFKSEGEPPKPETAHLSQSDERSSPMPQRQPLSQTSDAHHPPVDHNKTSGQNKQTPKAAKAQNKTSSVSGYYNNANPNATGIMSTNAPRSGKSNAPAAKAKAVPPAPEVKSNPILDKPKTIETTFSPKQGQSPDGLTPEPSERVISEEENTVRVQIEKARREFKRADTKSKVSISKRNFNHLKRKRKRKYPHLDWRDLGK